MSDKIPLSNQIPKCPTRPNLAADIADRIAGMQLDSRTNNAQTIETLLSPVYDQLHNEQLKVGLLKLQVTNLTKMAEEAQAQVRQLRQ